MKLSQAAAVMALHGHLEGSPHNYIHNGFVRGDMGKLGSAALDPIFWLHHANIDRLWSVWNARGNNNSTDPAWLNEKFRNMFFDKNGNPVRQSAFLMF